MRSLMYDINKTIYNDFSRFEENKMKGRSYFIPFASEEELASTTYLDERYKSSRIQLLNGMWDFKYYKSINDLNANFVPDKEKFDKLEVPATWQRNGYDQIAYINTRYPFKKNPPHIPNDIPVGVYRTKFNIDDNSPRIITFLGVANNLSLYVNGSYVGYSEGTHNSAEFDLTQVLHVGENELVAVIFKWCNGTYLECQDMFRENGIIRDVYITKFDENRIIDFEAKEKLREDGSYDLTLSTWGDYNSLATVRVKIKGPHVDETVTLLPNEDAMSEKFSNKGMVLSVPNHQAKINLHPNEWTAETPYLYEAIVSLIVDNKVVECFRQYIGFKHINIDGKVFKFNDKNIKMKGVNHHDTNPVTGYVMTIDDLKQDIELMKEYNVNTVRTSHYPPDPIMLTMCDFYGLYVIDEADIETHGFYAVPYTTYNPNRLSNDETWQEHYLDRVERMYLRDRNHPSITMWSLGNEAGGCKCQNYCYDYLKNKVKSDVPVHYEGVIRSKQWAYDVVSHMYAGYELMEGIRDGSVTKDIMGNSAKGHYDSKPFIQCEYAHAMGVGPGGLEDYMQLFLSCDQFMGGCIWEWADHSVYDPEHKFSKWTWTYGGDHGEKIHDGNFCVDGLFFPDRTPSSGALNMKAVYRPIRATLKDKKGEFEFFNTNTFIDSSNIVIKYSVLQDGNIETSGNVDIVIAPWEKKVQTIPLGNVDLNSEVFVKFTYIDKKTGDIIAEDGEFINEKIDKVKMDKLATYEKKDGNIEVKFNGGKVLFSKKTGEMISYNVNGIEYINTNPTDGYKGFTPKVYRKEFDNERFFKMLWMANGLKFTKEHKTSVKLAVAKDGSSKVIVKYGINTHGIFRELNAKVEYTIDNSGKIKVESTLSKVIPFVCTIPRFGLAIELNPTLNNIKYYGRGNVESLSDFNAHALIGIHETTVKDMPMNYIMPQDSGNRSEVRWVEFSDNDGNGVKIIADGKAINFNANEYSYNTLCNKKANHIEDLARRDTNQVYIDGFVRGTGTNSCGPLPKAEHIVKVKYNKPLKFSFVIEPLKK